MFSRMRRSGRSGPRARRTSIRRVPESRSCSIGPRNRLSPIRSSPSGPVRCQLSTCGQARLERDVNDPPERQPSQDRARARAHACLTARLAGAAGRRARGAGAAVRAVDGAGEVAHRGAGGGERGAGAGQWRVDSRSCHCRCSLAGYGARCRRCRRSHAIPSASRAAARTADCERHLSGDRGDLGDKEEHACDDRGLSGGAHLGSFAGGSARHD